MARVDLFITQKSWCKWWTETAFWG